MTETSPAPPGSTPVKTAVKAVLGLQLGIALFLVGGGLLSALPHISLPSPAPSFDAPVLPGDQTRRYRPSDMPLGPARDGNPARPYTSTGDMPDRLSLALADETLALTGRIAEGDANRVVEFLQAQIQPVARVRLNSPGGSVGDALSIGRQLRERQLNTLLGAGDICLSACPYILAAGLERIVHPDAQVGLHQHYFGSSTILPAFLAVEDIQSGQGRVMRYLHEMGVDVLIMQHALATPPDEIYVLLPEQLTEYNLATSPGDG